MIGEGGGLITSGPFLGGGLIRGGLFERGGELNRENTVRIESRENTVGFSWVIQFSSLCEINTYVIQ